MESYITTPPDNPSVIKIAVVGPESTGKSSMAQFLAQKFDTIWIDEFARSYCQGLDNIYSLDDEMAIFHGQLALESRTIRNSGKTLVFCDTMFLNVKIWCDHLFGTTPESVLDRLRTHKYDFFLLMDIDLPWEDDPLRDFPEDRSHFMNVWKHELSHLKVEYVLIQGHGEARLQQGLEAVQHFLGRTICGKTSIM